MTLETSVALAVGLAASGEDLWRRNISNWIPASALLGALLVQCRNSGWSGLLDWFLGATLGFCVFLVFYLLGGMGGGDVKLMAGFGSLLGPSRLLEASLLTAAIGGLIAMIVVLKIECNRFWLRRRKSADMSPQQTSSSAPQPDDKYIPYAPAITLGSWLALIPKGV
ncbi:MAG: prepilin peptidase [Bryobacter sp.]|jgi:prepilin peptidase CpaA|nr:prepilin peptidase [Bryobacter sp. CoA8 C33]